LLLFFLLQIYADSVLIIFLIPISWHVRYWVL
jgi:hypothetical protein